MSDWAIMQNIHITDIELCGCQWQWHTPFKRLLTTLDRS